jgi:hypothetical protein
MTNKKNRRRSKTLTFMLLPALIFIGIMGLFLYLTDNQYSHASKNALHRVKQSDSVTFVPAIYEEEAGIINK